MCFSLRKYFIYIFVCVCVCVCWGWSSDGCANDVNDCGLCYGVLVAYFELYYSMFRITEYFA